MSVEQVILKSGGKRLNDVFLVNSDIPEFSSTNSKEYFTDRLGNKDYLDIVAYHKDKPVGYMLGYDRYNDGSFYCWMAGVMPEFRRMGVLSKMMAALFAWSRENGFETIRIKTRNDKRAMLSFLIKNNFNFLAIEKKESLLEYKISLIKYL